MKPRLLIPIFALALLATACASTRTMIISEEVQNDIEKRVKGRNYLIHFDQPYSEHYNPRVLASPDQPQGTMQIQGDTLKLHFNHPVYEISDDFLIHDYHQSKTDEGVTVITFFIMRYDKKRQKEIRVPFSLAIYTPYRIDVTMDGDAYFGAFQGNDIHYKLLYKP